MTFCKNPQVSITWQKATGAFSNKTCFWPLDAQKKYFFIIFFLDYDRK
jgi:hypothetical protein